MQGSTVDYCSDWPTEGHYWISTSHARTADEPPIFTRQCRRCGYLDLTELRRELRPRLRAGVTACIATHPSRQRNGKLLRALASVAAQERQPEAIIIGNDLDMQGAGWNRQRILDQVQTEWMAWLDSDDEWLPRHLKVLYEAAYANPIPADRPVFLFPWMMPEGDPLGHFGIPFNPATPHHTTITFMVRTELARRVGFVNQPFQGDTQRFGNEDWYHILGLCKIAVDEGLPMVHVAERTWRYNMDGGNTSGVGGQGDAR